MARKRVRRSVALTGDYRYYNGSWWSDPPPSQLLNVGTCIDDVHDVGALGKGGNVGSGFTMDSTDYFPMPGSLKQWIGSGASARYYESDGFVPTSVLYADFNDQPFQGPHNNVTLDARGTTAIARTAPTNPSFSLSQFVGELRNDGLPSVTGLNYWRDRRRYQPREGNLKHTGDEYLNYQFGIRPLVSDVQSFARTVKQSHKIISEYHRNSDKRIRRRYSFPAEEWSKTVSGEANIWPNIDANGSQFGRNGTHTRKITRETWFSGAFRYHIPMGKDFPSRMSRFAADADKLLGVKLTPEVVYNLTPWSWALDWFTNTGDLVTNISRLGSDGLVLEWGYIMCRYIQTDEVRAISASGQPIGLTTVTKSLRRVPATPYGFGFNMTQLSARQEAVLVALGLSKGAR